MKTKTTQDRISHWAFTRADLIVVMMFFAVLAALLIPGLMKKATARSSRINCVNNLKQVGVAFRMYASDSDNHYPQGSLDGSSNAWVYFQMAGTEINNPKTVLCPVDKGRPFVSKGYVPRPTVFDWPTNGLSINYFAHPINRNAALSYFYGVEVSENYPAMFLAGDRNLNNTTNRSHFLVGRQALTTNSATVKALFWNDQIHKGFGNVALTDGSVQQLATERLWESLIHTGDTNGRNAVVFPQSTVTGEP